MCAEARQSRSDCAVCDITFTMAVLHLCFVVRFKRHRADAGYSAQ